jgi:hypothetical protein
MNIPETFYIALCVTILMLGVIYWFWTQVQYLQRKVNLLDNVVYEMKTLVSNLPGPGSHVPIVQSVPDFTAQPTYPVPFSNHDMGMTEESNVPAPYAPPPESVAGDLEQEMLQTEQEFTEYSGANQQQQQQQQQQQESALLSENLDQLNVDSFVQDDLQPGGLASPQFEKKRSSESDSTIESPLSSMSIKELRRMAEANNIPGAGELRKKDLIRALRDKVSSILKNDTSSQSKVISFDEIDAPGSD